MTDREAMKLALEALKASHPISNTDKSLDKHSEAMFALRQALEQPSDSVEQEPMVLNQFLSDVMTAAGLVKHGKQSKALAARLRVEVMKLHTALRAALEQPDAIEAAVRAENEACAKVCESLRDEDGYEAWGVECAAAIRARMKND